MDRRKRRSPLTNVSCWGSICVPATYIIARASQSLHDASIEAGVTVNLGYKEVRLGHRL